MPAAPAPGQVLMRSQESSGWGMPRERSQGGPGSGVMRCMSATDEVESGDEQEVGPRTRRSWVVLVAASMSALLTLSYPPLTIAGLVFILEQGVMPADAVAALWLSAITTTGLLVATVGLWLLRPFGWRCALAFGTIAVVDQARVLLCVKVFEPHLALPMAAGVNQSESALFDLMPTFSRFAAALPTRRRG